MAIIALGINLLLGRRTLWLSLALIALLIVGSVGVAFALAERDEDQVVARLVEPLGDLKSVNVYIDFGAGELVVKALPPESPNLVEAQFDRPSAKASLTISGNSGNLNISRESRTFFRRVGDVDWDIAFSRHPSLLFELDGGAADVNLDLRELQVTSLGVDTGASDVAIALPASAGSVQVNINGGAAKIDITIPEGVAARIRQDSGLSSIIDVNTSRFPKANGDYVSPDFETAQNRVDIELRVGAASVSVR